MRIFTKLILLASLPLLASSVATASITTNRLPSGIRNARFADSRNLLSKGRAAKINSISGMLESGKKNIKSQEISPDVELGPVSECGTLDGPEGEVWYYTSNLVHKVIKHEYYTELIPLEYTFTIYDAKMNEIGSVHDKVRYAENECRAVSCDLIPAITRKFFNNDDNYEVMVWLGFNTDVAGKNNYRTYAYSLGGEKETLPVEDPGNGQSVDKAFDKPIYTIEDSIGDILNASTPDEENFYISVFGETLPDFYYGEDEEISDEDFWEQMMKSHITVTTYSKVQPDGKMGEVLKFEIPLQCLPGDQENSPYMISYMHEGTPYVATARYKDSFWNPYGPSEEQSMRESNTLEINIYTLTNTSATKVQSTDIAFVKDTSNPDVLATYMGIGDLRYAKDICYDTFTTDGLASFYVTQNNFLVGEATECSYFVYNPQGKRIKNIFRQADSTLPMSDIPGFEPQQMFVNIVGEAYVFNFVDLVSCKTTGTINYMFSSDPDSDPEMLSSNMDRIQTGDGYKYAFEMRYPVEDEGNTLLRVAWFNADCTFDDIETVNLGENVQYAMVYIENDALRPDLFNNDPEREYMVLVKRGIVDAGNEEQLLIGQPVSASNPSGKTIFETGPDDRGNLQYLYLNSNKPCPMLTISRYDSFSREYYWSFYYLPFASSAVEEIGAGSAIGALKFTGTELISEGNVISVYNLNGAQAATGSGMIATTSLPAGPYIAVANGTACKFIVK